MSDYFYKRFAIISRFGCPDCGLFSFYIVHLGCLNKFLNLGYIPIIDLQSFPNIYNKGNISSNNPWELYFYQPFNYNLYDVKKYANKKKYFECTANYEKPNPLNIYYDNKSMNYWHNFANKYMPLKRELLQQANNIMKNIFGNSKNILGVIIRGTDYISSKPKGHPIPPKVELVISDVILLDKKYNYDFIFFSTEDDYLKNKFISVSLIKNKIIMLDPNMTVQYNYLKKSNINLNEKVYGNHDFFKNYILNIIILSKCLDLVAARCSGTAGIMVLTKGYRHKIIYNLGEYK